MAAPLAGPDPPVRDIEAKQKEFDSIPLFMRSLPDDPSSNEQIAALQSLIFDEEPNGLSTTFSQPKSLSRIDCRHMNIVVAALNFKDHGNDYFKERRFREALHFYTQGISVKPDDNAVLEALLCNRAACNLELRESFWTHLRSRAISLATSLPE
jgi:small subunit ribosomal protein S7e